MSISSQTYKQYSFSHHGEVYIILEAVFAKYKIKYYLIGANARDVQLYKIGIKPSRGTADIDFAIMIPDFDTYNSIFEELCTKGFEKTDENYRLNFKRTNTVLDLMPYGEIEEDYTVNFMERDVSLSVLGFKEVGDNSEIIKIKEEDYVLPVTPVEGILILKLISWSEKPEKRVKDLEDISTLLQYGWDFYEEEAYNNHLDLFDDEDFEMNKVAARIIGRKMNLILKENVKLKETIISILKKSIIIKDKVKNPELVLAQQMDKTIQEVQKILSCILIGINDL